MGKIQGNQNKSNNKRLCSSPLLGLILILPVPCWAGTLPPSTMEQLKHPKHWDEAEGAGDGEYPKDLGMQVGKGLEENDW